MLRPYDLKSLCLAVGAFALFTTSFSPAAHAVLTLSLNEVGGGSQTIVDTDGDGKVFFNGTLTNFTTNFTAGVSDPILIGTPSLIDLVSLNISELAGTLIIELSDTGYTNPTSYLNSLIGGTTAGTVTYETFVDTTNGNPFAGTLLASKTLDDPSFNAGSLFPISLSDGSPYSLGIRVTVEHGSGVTNTSFNSEIRIPEPGSLGLLGSGLVLAGLLLRQRRKTRQA